MRLVRKTPAASAWSESGPVTHPGATGRRELAPQHMATQTITIRIRVAWWFSWWLAAVLLFANLMGMEPDPNRILAMLAKAIRIG